MTLAQPLNAPYGASVILVAAITPSDATGAVTFFDGVVPLGSAPVVSAGAVFTTTQLGSGLRILRASFTGDAVTGSSTSNAVQITITAAPAQFLRPAASSPTLPGRASAVLRADVNGDGIPDLIVSSFSSAGIAVLIGNGDGTFGQPQTYAAGYTPAVALALADFNGDGKVDVAYYDGGSLRLYLGDGAGNFAPTAPVAGFFSGSDIVAADFNEDGRVDVAIAEYSQVIVLPGKGDGTFQPPVTNVLPVTKMAVGDFNGDGHADIAYIGSGAIVAFGKGDGTFQPAIQLNNLTLTDIAAGDFNKDAISDIAFVSTNAVGVLLGSGAGTFQTAVQVTLPGGSYYTPPVVGDFDGDGNADVALVTSSGISLFRGSPTGAIQPILHYATLSPSPTLLAAGDFNGDRRMDIAVVAGTGPTALSVFLGTAGTLIATSGSGQSASTGSPFAAPLVVTVKNSSGAPAPGVEISFTAPASGASASLAVSSAVTDSSGVASTTASANFTRGGYTVTASAGALTAGFALTNTGPVSSVTLQLSGRLIFHQQGVFTALVSNLAGSGPATGASVSPLVPTGLRLVSMAGSGWDCPPGNPCIRTDPLPAGSSYPPVTITVDITATTPGWVEMGVVAGTFGAPAVTLFDTEYVSGATVCSYSLSPSSTSTNFSNSVAYFKVNAPADCPWKATTSDSWLDVPGNLGVGNSSGNYSVAVNTSPSSRVGTITVAGQVFTITQQPAPSALRFVPVTPCRVADTRNPSGPYGGLILAGGVTRNFDIPGSACGIPSNAAAYSLNIAVVPAGPLGYLTAWPAGQPQPQVATLNSLDGRTKANAAIVPAAAGGAISIFASNPTHVILDINGYFVPAAPGANLAFYSIAPCRLADSRRADGTFGGPFLAAAVPRSYPVLSGPCGIPPAARAYTVVFTVVPRGPLGYLTAWPAGQSQPGVATLNAVTGVVTANTAILPAGANGDISVFASNNTDLVVDVTGYFAPPAASSMDFYAATPCRIVDTRDPISSPFPSLAAGVARPYWVPQLACGIPTTAKAYSLNATVVPPAPLGYLTLWGDGAQPLVSTLNSLDGTVVANAAITPAGADGVITAFASNATDIILDINGYFQ